MIFLKNMNGSTFKLSPNALGKLTMMKMINCDDSHVINGAFEGDRKEHDYEKASFGSEFVNGILMGYGTKYSSFDHFR